MHGQSTLALTLLLTPRQAAVICGMSLRTWWRKDAAGQIPAPVTVEELRKAMTDL